MDTEWELAIGGFWAFCSLGFLVMLDLCNNTGHIDEILIKKLVSSGKRIDLYSTYPYPDPNEE